MRGVTFNEEEIIINPEDVDPSVGRFRNLIQTTVIPSKKLRLENSGMDVSSESPSTSSIEFSKNLHQTALIIPHLYQGLPPTNQTASHESDIAFKGSKLGISLPNPAPDVLPITSSISNVAKLMTSNSVSIAMQSEENMDDVPKKKKYAKEAWPGRKPLLGSL